MWWRRRRDPRTAEERLDTELRFFLEARTETYVAQGMSESEARRAARLELGGMERVKDDCRDVRPSQWVDSLGHDVRYALKTMWRSPGFTAVALVMLALGISVNAIVFSLLNSVLFRGFPLVRGNERLVYMTTGRGCCVSYPDFHDWQAQASSFDGMALVHGFAASLSQEGDTPESVTVTDVTSETFALVGQHPILGRDFTPADEEPGARAVVILRYGLWARRFGSDPNILGRSVFVNRAPATIVGVMPPGFSFPQNQDLWRPFVHSPDVMKRDNRDTWFAVGRLKDGVGLGVARLEIAAIAQRLAAAYPDTNANLPPQMPSSPQVLAFADFFIGESAIRMYRALWGAVGFVLLIACANLANLLLGRASGRAREIAMRIALGASRWRIMRQLLVESLVLSSAGALIAWWIVQWGVRVYALYVGGSGISNATGKWFDEMLDYSLDFRVFAYLALLAGATGVLFGLAPARQLSRVDVNATLKDGGHRASAGSSRYVSMLLVAGEMALAVVLLTSAGLMIRSFIKLASADIGVDTEHLATALVSLPVDRYRRPDTQGQFADRLREQLDAMPGIDGTILADAPPGQNAASVAYEDADAAISSRQYPRVAKVAISAGYFKAVGARVTAGREFTDADRPRTVPVVIVNQRFARQHWPEQNPIGKRIRLIGRNGPDGWMTVVGEASNIVQSRELHDDPDPVIYVPYLQRPGSNVWVMMRSHQAPSILRPALARALRRVDPALPVSFGPTVLKEQIARNRQYLAVTTTLLIIFAMIALLLASIGLYAVVAHAVSRRTQEIGIRLALGASRRDIVSLVFREGLPQLLCGLAVGIVASLAVNRVLQAQLVRTSTSDPATLASVAAILVSAAVLGCWLPARRALRTSPIQAIRVE